MNKRQRRQDHLEQALAHLAGISADLDEVVLRNRQAIRRTSLVEEVLDPALERLKAIRKELDRAQHELKLAWLAGRDDDRNKA